MNTQILGLYYVTAMISSTKKIYRFFTDILGLRLIKKIVNQDDIETYRLFSADSASSPGTDVTFFDFPGLPRGTKGISIIPRTSFRVKDDTTLDYWVSRSNKYVIDYGETQERLGKKYLELEDFDNQRYQLISDGKNQGVTADMPRKKSNVPSEHALIGLGPVFATVENYEHLQLILIKVLGFKLIDAEGSFYLLEAGGDENGVDIIVEHREDLPAAQKGYGNVHHLALHVADGEALHFRIEKINRLEFPNSGFTERFYFKSEYLLAATHVLFKLATDGPGFLEDETYEHTGEKLLLPPFLESKWTGVEGFVRPFDTSGANVQRNQYLF